MNDRTREYVRAWLSKANSDLKNAEIIMAVEMRYPDDFYMPARPEAEESLAIATEIRDFILARIGFEYGFEEDA